MIPITTLFNPNASGWNSHAEAVSNLVHRHGDRILELDEQGRWTEKAIAGRSGRLCVCGGDGTLSRVVQQLDERQLLSSVELAVLPLGTGNDFARSIGVHGLTLEAAYTLAKERPASSVDLIQVSNESSHPIVNGATAGFGGMVSQEVTTWHKQQWGALAYLVVAFSHLNSPPEFEIELTSNGQSKQHVNVIALAISSGRYVGGGFPVAPDAFVNDGLLNVTVMPLMPLGEILSAGIDFTLGRHLDSERIVTFAARELRVTSSPRMPFSLDGDCVRIERLDFMVRPNELQIVVHQEAPAFRALPMEA